VALIPVGAIPDAEAVAQALQAALQQQDPAAQVLLSSDLGVASHCQAQLLLTAPGAASRRALRKLQQDLGLQGRPVAGQLLLVPQPAEAESSHGA
jgi:L-2-hydroxyglutarate oxidase LhgO